MADTSGASAGIEGRGVGTERDLGSRVFAQLADAYRREGLLDEAIRICREGLASHPASVNGRLVLGQALLEREAFEEAEKECGRVLKLAPDNLPALRLLGDVLLRRGKQEEARKQYEQVLRLNPLDRDAQGRLAALTAGSPAWPSPEGECLPESVAATEEEPGVVTLEDSGALLPAGDVGGGGQPGQDPLASPTLAALYAAQGHAVIAEAIYAQLEPQGGHGTTSPSEVIMPPIRRPGMMLERFQALRQAARRLREAARR